MRAARPATRAGAPRGGRAAPSPPPCRSLLPVLFDPLPADPPPLRLPLSRVPRAAAFRGWAASTAAQAHSLSVLGKACGRLRCRHVGRTFSSWYERAESLTVASQAARRLVMRREACALRTWAANARDAAASRGRYRLRVHAGVFAWLGAGRAFRTWAEAAHGGAAAEGQLQRAVRLWSRLAIATAFGAWR